MSQNASLAMVFPGQGSQSVGMLAELHAACPVVGEVFTQASDVLGFDLWNLIVHGPADRLNATVNTQPAMLAADIAVWRAWEDAGGPLPAQVAGHSLGEYSALVCAGALDFSAALTLVRERARCMQEAVPEGTGAMAAILGLDDAQVIDLCASAGQGQIVAAANFNAPGQVVVAGHADAVKRALELAREQGARRSVLLPVSVPSHCDCMLPAAKAFSAFLNAAELVDARIPVVQNVDAGVRTDAPGIRTGLLNQLHSPVRWVESVLALRAGGARSLLECGPGRVLTALTRRIDRELYAAAIGEPAALQAELARETT